MLISKKCIICQKTCNNCKILSYGHLIVEYDLHSHGGELPDGIAEAFIE